ncbi:amidohydrolase family protein [Microbulbifer epialgicus]|uniref:Amidohydrolase family protein n=1 Tax=Microbulbifer epialgicus TaxID=393907 RepID=A0ABV4P6H3_9GAMM
MLKEKLKENISNHWRARFAALSLAGILSTMGLSQAYCADTFAIEGGKWFDGAEFKPATWFVDENGSLTKTRPKNIDHIIEVNGKFVVPPYGEGHNHNLQNPWAVKNFGPLQVSSGVFYSVQMCSFGEEVKAQFSSRDTMDVLFASDCITASDGHPLGLILNGKKEVTNDELKNAQEMVLVADSKEDLDQIWEKVKANHPSFIKIILVGSEKFEERHGDKKYLGINGLNPKLVPRIVERAHQSGIPVAAHVDTAHDAEVAIKAGVDVLGHLPGYRIAKNEGFDRQDYVLSDAVIAEAAKRGTKLIATANVPSKHYTKEEISEIQANQRDNLRRLRKAGATILMGSDNFSGTVLSEIRYLDALGIAPREALLKSLTMDTPKWMYPGRHLGVFAEGAEGSFLVLEGNPLEDLGFLDQIHIGVKQGYLNTEIVSLQFGASL